MIWPFIALAVWVIGLISGMAWWAGRDRRAERSFHHACEREALESEPLRVTPEQLARLKKHFVVRERAARAAEDVQ